MISKKRYWGLALPIYECDACGTFEVIGSEDELRGARRRGLGRVRGPLARTGPGSTRSRSPARKCGATVARITDVGNPWLDAGIVPFSTLELPPRPRLLGAVVPGRLRHRELPRPVPQLVLLAAGDEHRRSRTARRSRPCFGYALLRDEKGEEMHKSKGNAIWFDDAAETMGADVMRWLFCAANPSQQPQLRLQRRPTRSSAASSCRSGTPTPSSSPTPASTASTRPAQRLADCRAQPARPLDRWPS